ISVWPWSACSTWHGVGHPQDNQAEADTHGPTRSRWRRPLALTRRGGSVPPGAFARALQFADDLLAQAVGDLLHHAAAELAEPADDVDVRSVGDFRDVGVLLHQS